MKDYTEHLQEYLNQEKMAYDLLPLKAINAVMNVLEEARISGKKVFICGNGGSAATASHFVCDFNKGVSYDNNQKNGYRFICLNDNIPSMMAIANDISYDDVFKIPLRNLMESGDVVIGISGSGNSENVMRAIQYANEHGAVSIGITGYDGGRLKKVAKYNIHVPVNDMQMAEDLHMVIDHMMMWGLCKAI